MLLLISNKGAVSGEALVLTVASVASARSALEFESMLSVAMQI